MFIVYVIESKEMTDGKSLNCFSRCYNRWPPNIVKYNFFKELFYFNTL